MFKKIRTKLKTALSNSETRLSDTKTVLDSYTETLGPNFKRLKHYQTLKNRESRYNLKIAALRWMLGE